MTSAYDPELRKLAAETGKELEMEEFMQTGVYFYVSGPSYETAAECRMIRSCGGDSVGMSTAPEVVVARHCGLRVLGMPMLACVCIHTDIQTKTHTDTHQLIEIQTQMSMHKHSHTHVRALTHIHIHVICK